MRKSTLAPVPSGSEAALHIRLKPSAPLQLLPGENAVVSVVLTWQASTTLEIWETNLEWQQNAAACHLAVGADQKNVTLLPGPASTVLRFEVQIPSTAQPGRLALTFTLTGLQREYRWPLQVSQGPCDVGQIVPRNPIFHLRLVGGVPVAGRPFALQVEVPAVQKPYYTGRHKLHFTCDAPGAYFSTTLSLNFQNGRARTPAVFCLTRSRSTQLRAWEPLTGGPCGYLCLYPRPGPLACLRLHLHKPQVNGQPWQGPCWLLAQDAAGNLLSPSTAVRLQVKGLTAGLRPSQLRPEAFHQGVARLEGLICQVEQFRALPRLLVFSAQAGTISAQIPLRLQPQPPLLQVLACRLTTTQIEWEQQAQATLEVYNRGQARALIIHATLKAYCQGQNVPLQVRPALDNPTCIPGEQGRTWRYHWRFPRHSTIGPVYLRPVIQAVSAVDQQPVSLAPAPVQTVKVHPHDRSLHILGRGPFRAAQALRLRLVTQRQGQVDRTYHGPHTFQLQMRPLPGRASPTKLGAPNSGRLASSAPLAHCTPVTVRFQHGHGQLTTSWPLTQAGQFQLQLTEEQPGGVCAHTRLLVQPHPQPGRLALQLSSPQTQGWPLTGRNTLTVYDRYGNQLDKVPGRVQLHAGPSGQLSGLAPEGLPATAFVHGVADLTAQQLSISKHGSLPGEVVLTACWSKLRTQAPLQLYPQPARPVIERISAELPVVEWGQHCNLEVELANHGQAPVVIHALTLWPFCQGEYYPEGFTIISQSPLPCHLGPHGHAAITVQVVVGQELAGEEFMVLGIIQGQELLRPGTLSSSGGLVPLWQVEPCGRCFHIRTSHNQQERQQRPFALSLTVYRQNQLDRQYQGLRTIELRLGPERHQEAITFQNGQGHTPEQYRFSQDGCWILQAWEEGPGGPRGQVEVVVRPRLRQRLLTYWRRYGRRSAVLLLALLMLYLLSSFYRQWRAATGTLEVLLARGCHCDKMEGREIGSGLRAGQTVVVAPGGLCHLRNYQGDYLSLYGPACLQLRQLQQTWPWGPLRQVYHLTAGQLHYQSQPHSRATLQLPLTWGQLALQRGNFWLRREHKITRIAVYRGSARLAAVGRSVTLLAGDATILVDQAPPRLPRRLLPAPGFSLPGAGQIFAHGPIICRWSPVQGARAYRLYLARCPRPAALTTAGRSDSRNYKPTTGRRAITRAQGRRSRLLFAQRYWHTKKPQQSLTQLRAGHYCLWVASEDAQAIPGTPSQPLRIQINPQAPGRVLELEIISGFDQQPLPDAQVRCQGQQLQSGIVLRPGQYELRVVQPGYRPQRVNLQLAAVPEPYHLRLVLTPQARAVSITCQSALPPFEKVAPDRISYHQGQVWQPGQALPPGKYIFTIQRRGYLPHRGKVTITPGVSPYQLKVQLHSAWPALWKRVQKAGAHYPPNWKALKRACQDYLSYGPRGGPRKNAHILLALCEFKIKEAQLALPGKPATRRQLWQAYQQLQQAGAVPGWLPNLTAPMHAFYQANQTYLTNRQPLSIVANAKLAAPPPAARWTVRAFYQTQARKLLLALIQNEMALLGQMAQLPWQQQRLFFRQRLERMFTLDVRAPYLNARNTLRRKISQTLRQWGQRLVRSAQQALNNLSQLRDYQPAKVSALEKAFLDFLITAQYKWQNGTPLLTIRDRLLLQVRLHKRLLELAQEHLQRYQHWCQQRELSLVQRFKQLLRLRQALQASFTYPCQFSQLLRSAMDQQLSPLLQVLRAQVQQLCQSMQTCQAHWQQIQQTLAQPRLAGPDLAALLAFKQELHNFSLALAELGWLRALHLPWPWRQRCQPLLQQLRELADNYRALRRARQELLEQARSLQESLRPYARLAKSCRQLDECKLPADWQQAAHWWQTGKFSRPGLVKWLRQVQALQDQAAQLPATHLPPLWKEWSQWQQEFQQQKQAALERMAARLQAWMRWGRLYSEYQQWRQALTDLQRQIRQSGRPPDLAGLWQLKLSAVQLQAAVYVRQAPRWQQQLSQLQQQWQILLENAATKTEPLRAWYAHLRQADWQKRLAAWKKVEGRWQQSYDLYSRYYRLVVEYERQQAAYQRVMQQARQYQSLAQLQALLQNRRQLLPPRSAPLHQLQRLAARHSDPWWLPLQTHLAQLAQQYQLLQQQYQHLPQPRRQYLFKAQSELAHHDTGRATSHGWAATAQDPAGYLLYGPSTLALGPGRYLACFFIKLSVPRSSSGPLARFEIWEALGERVLASRYLRQPPAMPSARWQTVELTFHVTRRRPLHFRIYHYARACLAVKQVDIWPLPNTPAAGMAPLPKHPHEDK